MPVQTRPRPADEPGAPDGTGTSPPTADPARSVAAPSEAAPSAAAPSEAARSAAARPGQPQGQRKAAPSAAGRAAIGPNSLRRDKWWMAPLVTVAVLTGFAGYGIWAALRNGNYHVEPYLSPFYAPCLTDSCTDDATPHILGDLWPFSPALIILAFPLGFRLTCYYYRKAYYRSFWRSPPACAIPDARAKYTGETRFPLILQNVHRYFFYVAVVFAGLLTYDAVLAFGFPGGVGVGVGSIVLVVNSALIWLYTLSCHSCRHLCGGKLKRLSDAPLRTRVWRRLSVLNRHHMAFAWASLVWIMVADFYVWLVASGQLHDFHWVP